MLPHRTDQPSMHCRKLLARLCIAREEIAEVVAEQRSPGESGSTQELYESNLSLKNQGIPKASLALLKELLNMSDKAKRYLLAHTHLSTHLVLSVAADIVKSCVGLAS